MYPFQLKLLKFIVFTLWASTALAGPISVTDDAGRKITLNKPAQRIVSLAPHVTEVLFAAGAGDKVVGTVSYSDYPEAAKAIPRVGAYNQVNFESILALAPDLIIAWHDGNSRDTLDQLASLNIQVYMSNPKDLESISNNLRQLGKVAGTGAMAEKQADQFDKKHHQLRETNHNKPEVTVFYQVWDDPLYTLAAKHFISDLYELCGGRNIFSDLNEASPIVSVESIVSRNPQVMITGGHHGKRDLKEWKNRWTGFTNVDAVKNGMMFLVNQDIYTRAAPRVLDAAEHLCAVLDQARTVYYPNQAESVKPKSPDT